MTRKICVVTGTRAEFGLLRWLMASINEEPSLTLQVVVTGTHLSPEHGETLKEIEEANILIDERVDSLVSGIGAASVAKSIGLGIIGFADVFQRLKPDTVVALGDRFEIMAACIAAMVSGIPITHLHGGELTEGSFDDSIRHSITKMSHLHFVATEEYRRRVIQLGEQPTSVFNVGGMGVDAIRKVKLMKRQDLEKSLGFSLDRKSLLVTFHPVTAEGVDASVHQMRELLAALEQLTDTSLIITMPNADIGGSVLTKMLEDFTFNKPKAKLFQSLGQVRYLSCLKYVDGVVGNSSSALLEAPTFKVGSINIGSRQDGRIIADSVINCEPTRDAISNAINTLYTDVFKTTLKNCKNPYGAGGSSKRIVSILRKFSFASNNKKQFFDIV